MIYSNYHEIIIKKIYNNGFSDGFLMDISMDMKPDARI